MTQNKLPEIVLIVAGLALRLAFAMLPRELHFMLLEDDAWMVTNIARHWALGHGMTADGVYPTNGFHPLYPLTLGALPYLLNPGNLDAGFRANLIICAILSTLVLIPFYALAHLVAHRPVALTGLAIVALNPFLIRLSVNGMETSLALLLLLTLWWYALDKVHEKDALAGIVMGVLAGLATLARLDTMIAAGMLGLVILWREVIQRRCLPLVSIPYGIAFVVVVLPYVARNMLVFGHLMPGSGRALAYMHSFRESFAFTSGLQLIAYQPALDLTWAPPWLLLLTLLGLAWLIVTITPQQRRMLMPFMLYGGVLTFYYAYMQQQGRPRYYVGVGMVVLLLLCAWLSNRWEAMGISFGKQREWRKSRGLPAASPYQKQHTLPAASPYQKQHTKHVPWHTIMVVGVAIFFVVVNSMLFVSHVMTLRQAPYLAQPSMYQAARWIADNLPEDARLAAQNSGVFQYYSERVILNIDGKLNHDIIPVLEERELDVYLRSKGIAYIVDLPGVADYVVFFSSSLSEAPTHAELSIPDKLAIYARMVAAKLHMGPPVQLDERVPTRIIRPFDDVTTIVKTFPLPNNSTQAVTIYKLKEDFGAR